MFTQAGTVQGPSHFSLSMFVRCCHPRPTRISLHYCAQLVLQSLQLSEYATFTRASMCCKNLNIAARNARAMARTCAPIDDEHEGQHVKCVGWEGVMPSILDVRANGNHDGGYSVSFTRWRDIPGEVGDGTKVSRIAVQVASAVYAAAAAPRCHQEQWSWSGSMLPVHCP